jgi:alpha-tubulin suppressor-like RCC1 family protein
MNHNLALMEDGEIFGWGDNSHCQLLNCKKNKPSKISKIDI